MKILIIKTGALGDVVRTSFIAQGLKEKYYRLKPKITWVVSESAKPLIEENKDIYEIISEKEIEKLKSIEFDLIINLEEGEELNKKISGIRNKKIIGFFYKNGKVVPSESAKEWYNMSALGEKPLNDVLKKRNKKTHRQIIGEMLYLDWKRYEPTIKLTKEQIKIAEEFRLKNKIEKDDEIIGLNLGGADRWPKSLPENKSIELIKRLKKKYKAKLILFGGPNELERNKRIIAKTNIIDAGCENSLKEFMAKMSICKNIISTDSLGLHVSLALKIRTIALVGPTSPTELDMYENGVVITAKSKDVCSYKKETNAMEKIDLNEVVNAIKLKPEILFLITSFKEPKTIGRAIESAIKQKTRYDYKVIVSAPDIETISVAKRYKKIIVFKDAGLGKSKALNEIFSKFKSDIIILTDGDVFVNEFAIENIINKFKNPRVGCVSGRPIPLEVRSNKLGYWANFLFDAAHMVRSKAYSKKSFLECSGYLFAFRNDRLKRVPLDVAEDTIIPYIFWERGYEIAYAEDARVYVKNVDNVRDWYKQKVRTSKAHINISKYMNIKRTPKSKSFRNESKGIFMLFSHPRNLKEIFWAGELAFARLIMWTRSLFEARVKKKSYKDGWTRIESTK